MAAITAAETDLLAQLRETLGEQLTSIPEARTDLHGQYKLVRFLRGHGHNVEAAATAWRAMMDFRAEVNADAVRDELIASGSPMLWPYLLPRFQDIRAVLQNAPPVHHGVDKLGRMVTVTNLKRWVLNDVVAAGLSQQMIDLRLFVDEYSDLELTRLSEEAGHPVGRHDIVDVTGVGLGHFNRASLNLLSTSGHRSLHYPESVARISAINFGWVTSMVFKLVKPLLPAQTVAKFSVLGSDYEGELRTLVEIEAMPARLGGSCACATCELYPLTCGAPLTREALLELEGGASEEVALSRREVLQRSCHLEPGETAQWLLALEAHTLDVVLTFEPAEYREAFTLDSIEPPRSGAFTATAAGEFTVSLDNSASRLRGKRVVVQLAGADQAPVEPPSVPAEQ